ncbi:MAG: hypothetical protein K0R57_4118 [Paenibacillaceae bacterium]|jgi:hypothetical protein|nr:hypothetical protein [Paenibacillaceae bacterium]
MKKWGWATFAAILCMVTVLTACGPKQGSGSNSSPNGGEQPVGILHGEVIRKTENNWLITAYIEKNGNKHIEAISYTVNEQTVLQTSAGKAQTADQIGVGSLVEAQSTSPILESYPSQTVASKIIVLEEDGNIPEGMIKRAAVVQAALEAPSPEGNMARAVKSAALDSASGRWSVELVDYPDMDKPFVVQVDARTGKMMEPAPAKP